MSLLWCAGGYCYMPAAHWFLLFLYAPSRNILQWRKPVLAADGKQRQPLCLFVCSVATWKQQRRRRLRGPLPSNIWEFAEPRAAMSGHIMACSCGSKSIFSSISSWIVPLAAVQERASAQWVVGENVGVDRREEPVAFFQFTTIRNRFPTISLVLTWSLLIKGAETVVLRQPWKRRIYDCWLCSRAAWCPFMKIHCNFVNSGVASAFGSPLLRFRLKFVCHFLRFQLCYAGCTILYN